MIFKSFVFFFMSKAIIYLWVNTCRFFNICKVFAQILCKHSNIASGETREHSLLDGKLTLHDRSCCWQTENGTKTWSTTAVRVISILWQYDSKLARVERVVTTFHPPMCCPCIETRDNNWSMTTRLSIPDCTGEFWFI